MWQQQQNTNSGCFSASFLFSWPCHRWTPIFQTHSVRGSYSQQHSRIHFWLQLHIWKRSRCQTRTTSLAVGFISYLKPPWWVKFGVLSAEEPLGLKLSIRMAKVCNCMFAFRRSAGLSQRYECKYGCWLNPMSSRSLKNSVLLNFVNLPLGVITLCKWHVAHFRFLTTFMMRHLWYEMTSLR